MEVTEDGTVYASDFKCKNLLPNNNTTQTINGITFTVNADKTVTVNGTATANTGFPLINGTNIYNDLNLKNGTYILSGCPTNGSQNGYSIYMDIKHLDDTNDIYYDIGEGLSFTKAEGDRLYIIIRVENGTTVSDLTFYPQIESGTVVTSYTPHKMSGASPVVLFNNPSGLFDDIALADNRSNYLKLEIYFIDDQNFQNVMTIDTSGNPFQLQFLKSGANRGSMYFISTRMYFDSNGIIKRGTTTIYNLIGGTITENTTADVLKITKIIGYR